MHSRLLTGSGLAIGIALLLAVNIFSNSALQPLRLDLTENQLYTLSQGTANVLAGLPEPVTVRLFLSQKLIPGLPGISGYATRVRELLEEYQRTAGDRLRLVIIDPEPFSEQEDQAVGYGLEGIPLGDGETTFYFGMVASGATDAEASIPFFTPEREQFLEYDITKLIHQVAHPKQKVIGLLSTLPMDGAQNPLAAMGGGTGQPWIILSQIKGSFEVRTLDKDAAEIPAEVDVLMLVHPKELGERTLYAIDQFVLRGGRALVFVDPDAESEKVPGEMGNVEISSSDLQPLLGAWGVQLADGKIVGDLQRAQQVAATVRARVMAVDYPLWMNLSAAEINAEDLVTANLGNVTIASAGHLLAKEGSGTTVTPLLQTTDQATEYDARRLAFLSDPQELLRNYQGGGKPLTLAARLTGKVASAFPAGPPEGASEHGAAHLRESSGPINVIVVADTDLLQDRFWVRLQNLLGSAIALPFAANGSLVINALDNLAGSNDLISVRNRGHFSRPFTRVEQLRQEAELRFRQKEQELIDRLTETERALVELERGKQEDSALILSEAQQQEIERFRQQKIQIRAELRQVRHELRKNIESLEGWLKFINIGLVPLLIALCGALLALFGLRRRPARRSAAAQ